MPSKLNTLLLFRSHPDIYTLMVKLFVNVAFAGDSDADAAKLAATPYPGQVRTIPSSSSLSSSSSLFALN